MSERDENGDGKAAATTTAPNPGVPQGWLMKRSRRTRRWRKQWFYLKNSSLCYGDNQESANKKIELLEAEILESSVDGRQNVFKIRPQGSKRCYYIQTVDKESLNTWMQAVCMAKLSGCQNSDQSQACVIQ